MGSVATGLVAWLGSLRRDALVVSLLAGLFVVAVAGLVGFVVGMNL